VHPAPTPPLTLPAQDELTRELKHTGAGILAMANSGRNTNGSQFYFTLAPCPHLDGKHTIFGRISGGMGTLRRMGLARTDSNDRPVDDVKILRARPVSEFGSSALATR